MAEICNVEINEKKFKKVYSLPLLAWETLPSEQARFMSMWSLIGWFFEDRLPLVHIIALLRIAKESLHLSQPISMLYCISFF